MYVLSRNMKNIGVFYLKNVQFLEMKCSIYLNRRVFVMFMKSLFVEKNSNRTFYLTCMML